MGSSPKNKTSSYCLRDAKKFPGELVIGERLVDDKFGNAKFIVLTHSFSSNMSPWCIYIYIYTHTRVCVSSKKYVDERGGG